MSPEARPPFTLLTFAPPSPTTRPPRTTAASKAKPSAASLELARKMDRLRQIDTRVYTICQALIESYLLK
jgi:hypothetical protein